MHTQLHSHKKNIVILGAGLCGLHVAKTLANALHNHSEYEVVLVDRKNMHIYSADLYEIGTAYYPRVTNACMRDLSETVAVPIKVAFKGHELTFLQDTVEGIHPAEKKVTLKKYGSLPFEYLVVALGSVTNFYDLPGVEKNSFPLKTVQDALALDCRVDQLFRERFEKNDHTTVHLVVGGGGFTGVEYACELVGFIGKLQKKYHFERKEVQIGIVQRGTELVGLGEKVSTMTMRRFQKLGIQVICNADILSYHDKKLEIHDKTTVTANSPNLPLQSTFIPADVLIWTAGVKSNPLLQSLPHIDKTNSLEVLPTLECKFYPQIYAGGDNASIYDDQKKQYLPKLGQLALQQGEVIGNNILADIFKKPQKIYRPFFKGFIVTLGGKYGIYHKNNITFGGFLPWLMRKMVDLWYFNSLLPFSKALKKWWHNENVFIQND